MLISGREAREELQRHGIPPWRARRAVELGLAGEPVVTRGAHLYDADAVRELGERRVVTARQMRTVTPQGYVVAQVNLSAQSSREALLAVARTGPGQRPALDAALTLIGAGGRMALVATVAGFVVACADAVGWRRDGLVLEDPGPWADDLVRTQVPTGKGRGWTCEEQWKWRAHERALAWQRAVGN